MPSSRRRCPGSPGTTSSPVSAFASIPRGPKPFIVNYPGTATAAGRHPTSGSSSAATVPSPPTGQGRWRTRSSARLPAGTIRPETAPRPAACPRSMTRSNSTWRRTPTARSGPTSSTATRPTGIWATGSPARSTPSARADVEARFNSITADHGWSAANRAMSLLRSIYRRPCVDHDGLRNPVDLWLAGGGKFHRKARRKISAPAEVLPCWRAGIEAEVNNPRHPRRPLVRALHRHAPG